MKKIRKKKLHAKYVKFFVPVVPETPIHCHIANQTLVGLRYKVIVVNHCYHYLHSIKHYIYHYLDSIKHHYHYIDSIKHYKHHNHLHHDQGVM